MRNEFGFYLPNFTHSPSERAPAGTEAVRGEREELEGGEVQAAPREAREDLVCHTEQARKAGTEGAQNVSDF